MARPKRTPTTADKIAATLLVAFLVVAAWMTLLSGGVSIRGRSGATTYVDGRPGILLALGTVALAGVASLLVVRAFALSRPAAWVLAAAIVLPPLAYLGLRS